MVDASDPNLLPKANLTCPPLVRFRPTCPTRGRLARSWQRVRCPCHHGHPRPRTINATGEKRETPSGESVAAQQVRYCSSYRTGRRYPATCLPCLPRRLSPIVVVVLCPQTWCFTAVLFFFHVSHFSVPSTLMLSRVLFIPKPGALRPFFFFFSCFALFHSEHGDVAPRFFFHGYLSRLVTARALDNRWSPIGRSLDNFLAT